MSPILETILIHLSALFLAGAGGDEQAARNAALQMLNAYSPENGSDLRLAANIVSFSFHALEALAQSATPDMPINRVLRLRGSAVSLNREAQKAEKRLEETQQARRQGKTAAQQAEPEPAPKVEKAVAIVADTRKVAAYAKANNLTWTQANEQRERDKRIAASVARAEAKVAAINAAEAAAAAHQAHATA